MEISQKYLHDRIVLILLTVSGFLAALNVLLTTLALSSGRGGNYIVEYRPGSGISEYLSGTQFDFIAFIIFSLVTLGLGVALSARIYGRHRSYALTILGLTSLLSLLTVIVSKSLLGLS